MDEADRVLELMMRSPDQRHRSTLDGHVISLWEQLYNWKITRGRQQDFGSTWDESW